MVIATVHVVGSNNDLKPWSGLVGGDRPDERHAEFDAREAAVLAWIDTTFARAESVNASGVLLMMQAEPLTTTPFKKIRSRIVQRSSEFGRPVLLVHGDEHRFEAEPGYAGVPTLTRLETFGNIATRWIRVTVDPSSAAVFSWAAQTV